MELGETRSDYLCSRRLTMHVNKVHRVRTIGHVAKELGESEDWLFDVATGMESLKTA